MKYKLTFSILFFSLFVYSQALINSNDVVAHNEKINGESKKENLSKTKSIILDSALISERFSSSKVVVFNFPKKKTKFMINDAPIGWTELGVSTLVVCKNSSNINLVAVEGTTQSNITSNKGSYQFAIGVFVDQKLKIIQDFSAESKSDPCNFSSFSFSGAIENLSIGKHEVKLYAINLSKTSADISKITYGGFDSDSCLNKNKDIKIHLAVQYSE